MKRAPVRVSLASLLLAVACAEGSDEGETPMFPASSTTAVTSSDDGDPPMDDESSEGDDDEPPPPPQASCGWGATGQSDVPEAYVCGGEGSDPSGSSAIACPAGLQVGDPCGSVDGIGCCDANGGNWYCADDGGGVRLFFDDCGGAGPDGGVGSGGDDPDPTGDPDPSGDPDPTGDAPPPTWGCTYQAHDSVLCVDYSDYSDPEYGCQEVIGTETDAWHDCVELTEMYLDCEYGCCFKTLYTNVELQPGGC